MKYLSYSLDRYHKICWNHSLNEAALFWYGCSKCLKFGTFSDTYPITYIFAAKHCLSCCRGNTGCLHSYGSHLASFQWHEDLLRHWSHGTNQRPVTINMNIIQVKILDEPVNITNELLYTAAEIRLLHRIARQISYNANWAWSWSTTVVVHHRRSFIFANNVFISIKPDLRSSSNFRLLWAQQALLKYQIQINHRNILNIKLFEQNTNLDYPHFHMLVVSDVLSTYLSTWHPGLC